MVIEKSYLLPEAVTTLVTIEEQTPDLVIREVMVEVVSVKMVLLMSSVIGENVSHMVKKFRGFLGGCAVLSKTIRAIASIKTTFILRTARTK
jgi:hypothetical protein